MTIQELVEKAKAIELAQKTCIHEYIREPSKILRGSGNCRCRLCNHPISEWEYLDMISGRISAGEVEPGVFTPNRIFDPEYAADLDKRIAERRMQDE